MAFAIRLGFVNALHLTRVPIVPSCRVLTIAIVPWERVCVNRGPVVVGPVSLVTIALWHDVLQTVPVWVVFAILRLVNARVVKV
jgi:hypothetical protein